MNIIDFIPVGYKNAITRERLSMLTGYSDRKNRKLIEEEYNSRKPVINIGTGYFIPAKGENTYVRIYKLKEASRISKVKSKLRMLDSYLDGNRQIPGQIELEDILGGE